MEREEGIVHLSQDCAELFNDASSKNFTVTLGGCEVVIFHNKETDQALILHFGDFPNQQKEDNGAIKQFNIKNLQKTDVASFFQNSSQINSIELFFGIGSKKSSGMAASIKEYLKNADCEIDAMIFNNKKTFYGKVKEIGDRISPIIDLSQPIESCITGHVSHGAIREEKLKKLNDNINDIIPESQLHFLDQRKDRNIILQDFANTLYENDLSAKAAGWRLAQENVLSILQAETRGDAKGKRNYKSKLSMYQAFHPNSKNCICMESGYQHQKDYKEMYEKYSKEDKKEIEMNEMGNMNRIEPKSTIREIENPDHAYEENSEIMIENNLKQSLLDKRASEKNMNRRY
jgi:hypothetical protein